MARWLEAELSLEMTKENAGWSESAERLWIRWTAIITVLWAAWYLTVPTVQSLLHLAARIRRNL